LLFCVTPEKDERLDLSERPLKRLGVTTSLISL
jgi:hypothetical protein